MGLKLKKAKLLIKIEIEKEIKTLHGNLNETNKHRYLQLQNQLNEIIENDIKGSILRSLCKDYEEGEKCSKYFFSLENIGASKKLLTGLEWQVGP